jgi:hypothetical protein
MTVQRHICPICGYPDLTDPPRSAVTAGGSYEICPSCGFQFGVTDDDVGYSYEDWRSRWIDDGMRWESAEIRPPPDGWDPVAQLRNIAAAD